MRKKPARHGPRTRKLFLDMGYLAVGNTEHWNGFARIRQDLFGFIDQIAVLPGEITALQITSASNHADRVKKILELEDAFSWLLGGGRIFVVSWRKKKNRWIHRIEEVTKEYFREDKLLLLPQQQRAKVAIALYDAVNTGLNEEYMERRSPKEKDDASAN